MAADAESAARAALAASIAAGNPVSQRQLAKRFGIMKGMLALFADMSDSATERKIRGIRSVDSRPIVRRIQRPDGVARRAARRSPC